MNLNAKLKIARARLDYITSVASSSHPDFGEFDNETWKTEYDEAYAEVYALTESLCALDPDPS